MTKSENPNDNLPMNFGKFFQKEEKPAAVQPEQDPPRLAQSTFAPAATSTGNPAPTQGNPENTPKKLPESAISHQKPGKAVPAKTSTPWRPSFQPGKALPAFWTVASSLSIIINIILIVALILVGRELFVLKSMVGNRLIGGLYENFIFMDQAHIKSEITVADTIPINFTLPISQDTVVVLTENTPINGAMVRINSGGLTINSAANIVLPAGTNLPVHLELNVPVTTTIPINIKVPVDIPLDQTELHKPFIGLQQVVSPFYSMLQPQIKGSQDMDLCKPFSMFCSWYFQK